MKKTLLSTAVRNAIAVTTVSSMMASVAIAQEDSQEKLKEEEVLVTGSRISRSNLTSNTAINIIDAQAVELSGAINTSELIRALPSSGVATFASTTNNFDTQNSGVNTVELRNLSEDRTLVLVNGRRFVGGIPGSQNVDFNSIPTQFIERIDVVTGGASAVYGSDALAGVINIVLKDSFEGFEVTGQGGRTDEGDDETYRITATGGFTFDDDRGSAMVSAIWDKENGVFARDRDNLGFDRSSRVRATGNPNDFATAGDVVFSSFSERGRFVIPNGVTGSTNNLVIADDGSVVPFSNAAHGFNRQAFRALSTPTERILVSSVLNYTINDNIDWFMETTYAGTETTSRLEPFPFSSADVYGDSQASCVDTDNDMALDTCANGIPGTNPFIPADILQAARTANPGIADDDLVIGFVRRTTELGPRGADNLRQTFRNVMGLKGSFLDDFNYEVSFNYGRTTQEQKSSGQINVLNMRYALDAIRDPNDANNIICRDAVARAQGCVPANVFGLGSLTAGLSDSDQTNLLRYLQANSSRTATIEQTVSSGFISGPLFELPGGTAQFSVGAEYRKEKSESIADGLSQQGLNAGNISPPTIGSFDVSELFAEVRLPLLADKPAVHSLEVELAARLSDYSTVGDTSAYASSVLWEPTEDVLIRGQYSRAVRAPNISELFQPLSESFVGGDDPCSGVTRDASGNPAFFNVTQNLTDPSAVLNSGIDTSTVNSAVATACLADPLVAQRVTNTGGLAETQEEAQGVGGFNGGAAAGGATLTEETADTVTLGVVWNPSFAAWAEPLSLTIDYFDISIEDAIAALARQDSLDNCYDGGGFDPTNAFCSNIRRFTTGPFLGALNELDALQQNLAEIETSGIDIQASYDFDLGAAGSLLASLTYTHLLDYSETPFEGADEIDSTGEVGFAEDKAVIGLTYRIGAATVAWTTQWIGESELSNDPGNAFFGASIPDQFFNDIQVRYEVIDGIELLVGADNITDEFVRIEQGGPDVPTGWNTRPDVYDALGARYYAGFKAKF